MRKLLLILLTCCAFAFAQAQHRYDDAALYRAYLAGKMSVWDAYLHATSFDKSDTEERLRYLNYEYGYVATAIDEKASDARDHLDAFEKHIAAMEKILSPARTKTYLSSAAAYEAMLNKISFLSNGLKSFNLVKESYSLDDSDPMVLTLKGNVDFYAPKGFGGNKTRAMENFRKAQRLYEQQGDTVNNWNYISTRLCIVQCEDKSGNTAQALKDANLLLKKVPDFVFLRDKYLPELRKKQAKSSAK